MNRVVVESPYAGPTPAHVERNLKYLRLCMRDCLNRGEAPFASHGLYTQDGVLDDAVPAERTKGIAAGFTWAEVAHKRVFYTDLGSSGGMVMAIKHASLLGQVPEFRSLATDAPELWAEFLAWERRQKLDHAIDGTALRGAAP